MSSDIMGDYTFYDESDSSGSEFSMDTERGNIGEALENNDWGQFGEAIGEVIVIAYNLYK